MKKVLVAMSGGVDSSVAAFLLKSAGYDCIGGSMRLFESADTDHRETEDAKSVCEKIGIPHKVFDLRAEFEACVIKPFVDCYTSGCTPNPCIECNRKMKFGRLYGLARQLGCDLIATGHYARIEKEGGRWLLKKGLDPKKDQSYVLYSLTEEQLSKTLFPLGGMKKEEIRQIAKEQHLLNAEKPDSQDICFVPDGNYAKVVEAYTSSLSVPGDYLDENGNVLGKHKGIIHYTVGQHKGLGIPTAEPLYVKEIRPADNRIILCPDEDLFDRNATVEDVHWISGIAPTEPFRCLVKIRYRHSEQPASVTPISKSEIRITFDEPQRAITPGQSAVLYDGDTVLGGGILQK